MKKLLILLSCVAVLSAALTGCASDKKDTTVTDDQSLASTTSMSEAVSEEITDMSEDVSEALTDASNDMAGNTTKNDTTATSANND